MASFVGKFDVGNRLLVRQLPGTPARGEAQESQLPGKAGTQAAHGQVHPHLQPLSQGQPAVERIRHALGYLPGSGAWSKASPLIEVRFHAARQMQASPEQQHPQI